MEETYLEPTAINQETTEQEFTKPLATTLPGYTEPKAEEQPSEEATSPEKQLDFYNEIVEKLGPKAKFKKLSKPEELTSDLMDEAKSAYTENVNSNMKMFGYTGEPFKDINSIDWSAVDQIQDKYNTEMANKSLREIKAKYKSLSNVPEFTSQEDASKRLKDVNKKVQDLNAQEDVFKWNNRAKEINSKFGISIPIIKSSSELPSARIKSQKIIDAYGKVQQKVNLLEFPASPLASQPGGVRGDIQAPNLAQEQTSANREKKIKELQEESKKMYMQQRADTEFLPKLASIGVSPQSRELITGERLTIGGPVKYVMNPDEKTLEEAYYRTATETIAADVKNIDKNINSIAQQMQTATPEQYEVLAQKRNDLIRGRKILVDKQYDFGSKRHDIRSGEDRGNALGAIAVKFFGTGAEMLAGLAEFTTSFGKLERNILGDNTADKEFKHVNDLAHNFAKNVVKGGEMFFNTTSENIEERHQTAGFLGGMAPYVVGGYAGGATTEAMMFFQSFDSNYEKYKDLPPNQSFVLNSLQSFTNAWLMGKAMKVTKGEGVINGFITQALESMPKPIKLSALAPALQKTLGYVESSAVGAVSGAASFAAINPIVVTNESLIDNINNLISNNKVDVLDFGRTFAKAGESIPKGIEDGLILGSITTPINKYIKGTMDMDAFKYAMYLTDDANMNISVNRIKQAVAENKMSKTEAQSVIENMQKIRNKILELPANMSISDKFESFKKLNEIEQLEHESSKLSEVFKKPFLDKIERIKKDLQDLSMKQDQSYQHEKEGATSFLRKRNVMGMKLSSVSMFPERDVTIEGPLTQEQIDNFEKNNQDLLAGNEDILSIDTWKDKDGKTRIGISAMASHADAKELGRLNELENVYDLENNREVSTGAIRSAETEKKSEADRIKAIREFAGRTKASEADFKPISLEEASVRLGENNPVIRAAKNGMVAVSKLLNKSNINIRFHDTNASMQHVLNTTRAAHRDAKTTKGNFSYDRNEKGGWNINIDINLANKADAATIRHELTHAVLLHAFGENPAMFQTMKDAFRKYGNMFSDKELIKFSDMYETAQSAEEYLAELSAIKNKIKPGTLARIAEFINDISKKFLGDEFVPFKNVNDANDIIRYFGSLAEAVRTGKPVEIREQKTAEEKKPIAEGEKTTTETEQPKDRIKSKQQLTDEERVTMSAKSILSGENEMLPQKGKKRNNSEVASIMQQKAMEFWGGDIVTSSTITPEQERIITENLIEEVKLALKESGNAADWYTEEVEVALKVASVMHPEIEDANKAKEIAVFGDSQNPKEAAGFALRLPLAITSQNLDVNFNSKYAEEQYEFFKKNGRFDPTKEYGSKAESISGNLKLANVFIEMHGLDGLMEFCKKEFTISELESVLQKILGKEVTISGYKNDIVNGSAMFGPKIGQGFLQNLMGNYNPVTIDLWARRTWGRITGDVVGVGVTEDRANRLVSEVEKSKKSIGIEIPSIIKKYKSYKNIKERLESDSNLSSELMDFSKKISSVGNSMYKAVHDQPMSKELFDDFISGKKTYEQVANELSKYREKAKEKYNEYAKKERSNKRKPISLNNWLDKFYESKGRTFSPTNKEISDRKPEWHKAATVIVNDIKPKDAPTDKDRQVMSRIINNVRKEFQKTTNADIQAIIWFPEKDIWAKMTGQKESTKKLSYGGEFIKIAESRGLGKQAREAEQSVRSRRAASTGESFEQRSNENIDAGVDENQPISKQQLITEKKMLKQMTEDEDGNFLFYHYSPSKITGGIDPRFFGRNLKTGRDERPGIGISMYYTRPDYRDVGGNYGYVVRVPKDKVYPFNADPLNLYDKAEAAFQKMYPGQAFDANKQVAFIAQEASKLGYKMTVAKWGDNLRAQTTDKLKPEWYEKPHPEYRNSPVYNPKLEDYKANENKPKSKQRLDEKEVRRSIEDVAKDNVEGIAKAASMVFPDAGYHRGSLPEKSDYATSSFGGDMPFTGYYFVSDPKDVVQGGSRFGDPKAFRIVDFSKYNLLKLNTNQYWVVKNALKKISRDIVNEGISKEESIERSSRGYGYSQMLEYWMPEFLNKLRSTDFSKEIDNYKKEIDKDEFVTERIETLILKKMGYEGVDVRGAKESEGEASPDSFSEGSVIFDLKDGTVSTLSEAYIKAKEDGSNPELVMAVEDAIGEPKSKQKLQPGDKTNIQGIDVTIPDKKEQDVLTAKRTEKKYFDKEVESMKPSSLSKEELKAILDRDNIAILTGTNPDGNPIDDNTNKLLNEKAEEWLQNNNYKYYKVTGKYGQTESSFLVEGMTGARALEFAKEFKQDSVAHSEGLIYSDSTIEKRDVKDDAFDIDVTGPRANYVSAIKTKDGNVLGFKIGIDFNERVEYEPKSKQQLTEEEIRAKAFTAEGGNKVVDEKGEPITVYHGTNKEFDSIDADKPQRGLFFAKDKSTAESYANANDKKGRVIEAKINLQNPHIIDAKGKSYDEIIVDLDKVDMATGRGVSKKMSVDEIVDALRGIRSESIITNLYGTKTKADGIIIKNVKDKLSKQSEPTDIYIPFENEQIKLESLLSKEHPLTEIPKSKQQLTEKEIRDNMDRMFDEYSKKMKGRPVAEVVDRVIRDIQHQWVPEENQIEFESAVRSFKKDNGIKVVAPPSQERISGQKPKEVTVKETTALKDQIRLEAGAARDAEKYVKNFMRAISDGIDSMVGRGVISANQSAAISRRMAWLNPKNNESVDRFFKWADKIFTNADYADRLNEANGLRKKIRENSASGNIPDVLKSAAARFDRISPDEVSDINEYNDIAAKLQEATKPGSIKINKDGTVADNMKVSTKISEIDKYIESQNDAIEKEKEKSEPKDDTEAVSFLKDKIEDMKSSVNELIETGKSPVDGEEVKLSSKEKAMVKEMMDIDTDDKQKLKRIAEAMDHLLVNGDMGKIPNIVLQNRVDVKAEKGVKILEKATSGNIKRLKVEGLISRIRGAMWKPLMPKNRKSYARDWEYLLNNSVRQIDLLLKQLDGMPVFNSTFRDLASGYANYKSKLGNMDASKAWKKMISAYHGDVKKAVQSNYKITMYLRQLEHESNPGVKKILPAIDYYDKTLESRDNGLNNTSKEEFRSVMKDFIKKDADGNRYVDKDALYNSMNNAEKEAVSAIQNLYKQLAPYAKEVANIRGTFFDPIANYSHVNANESITPGTDIMATEFENFMNGNVSTRAGQLESRTGKAVSISLDPFATANKAIRDVMLDYYMTNPIKVLRKITEGFKESTAEGTDEDMFAKAFQDISKALVKKVVHRSYSESSIVDKAIEIAQKRHIEYQLANPAKAAAEVVSNMGYISTRLTKEFGVGAQKYSKFILGADGSKILENVNSYSTDRLYPHGFSGKFIDPSAYDLSVSDTQNIPSELERVRSVAYYNTLLRLQKRSKAISETMLTSPDVSLAIPTWFGSMALKFKEITGKEIDFDKISANDFDYMEENRKAIEQARDTADKNIADAFSTKNPFLVSPRLSNVEERARVIHMMNNYLSNFSRGEFEVVREAIVQAAHDGHMSKTDAARTLAAATVRAGTYKAMRGMAAAGLTALGAYVYSMTHNQDDDDELTSKLRLAKNDQEIAKMELDYFVNKNPKIPGVDPTVITNNYMTTSDRFAIEKMKRQAQPANTFAQDFTKGVVQSGIQFLLNRNFGSLQNNMLTAHLFEEYFNKPMQGKDYDRYRDAILYDELPSASNEYEAFGRLMEKSAGPIGTPAVWAIGKLAAARKRTEDLKKVNQEISDIESGEPTAKWTYSKYEDLLNRRRDLEKSVSKDEAIREATMAVLTATSTVPFMKNIKQVVDRATTDNVIKTADWDELIKNYQSLKRAVPGASKWKTSYEERPSEVYEKLKQGYKMSPSGRWIK